MSQEPKDQPVYYSPAPATQASYSPDQSIYPPQQPVVQQPGTPVYQYAQPSPQQQNVLQQPYYPPVEAQSPVPQQQQIYYAQQPAVQQQQPNVVYTTATATPAAVTTIPVSGNGRGLTGKMPQLDNCCLCFPLHTGAMIIAFLMFIFYGYCGLALIAFGSFSGTYGTILLVVGILYLAVAGISIYGFVGIYKENVEWVDKYVKMFLIGSLIWLILEIISIILQVVYYNSVASCYAGYCYSVGVNWAGVIIVLILGVGLQYYFCVALVSYQRILHSRVESLDGNVSVVNGGTYVAKDIPLNTA
ncbi:hypothetical protein BGZ94_008017 [Podila epigama]|nr:hypothetical protein BGZ94_008017 [Podila epigama]